MCPTTYSEKVEKVEKIAFKIPKRPLKDHVFDLFYQPCNPRQDLFNNPWEIDGFWPIRLEGQNTV